MLTIVLIFVAWTTLTTFTALNYALSFETWLLNIKTFTLVMLVLLLIDRPSRIHALMIIVTISIGYWGIVCAIQTIASMGNAKLLGPAASMIRDNNHLAVALVMVLPIMEYCRYVSRNLSVRVVCAATISLSIVAIFGTYSRGGLIALASVVFAFWWKSRSQRLAVGLLVAVVALATMLLPQKWSDRMTTIELFQSERSFQSRFDAWKTAFRIGLDRPLLGAGFRATEDAAIYGRYKSEGDTTTRRAVHNAFLQVLAEHGFVGLGLFGLMLLFAFRDCRWLVKQCSNTADYYWLAYLARMLEIGFIGFVVGGLSLSLAYYDVFLVLIVVPSILREYAQREIKELQERGKPSLRVPGYAVAAMRNTDTALR